MGYAWLLPAETSEPLPAIGPSTATTWDPVKVRFRDPPGVHISLDSLSPPRAVKLPAQLQSMEWAPVGIYSALHPSS